MSSLSSEFTKSNSNGVPNTGRFYTTSFSYKIITIFEHIFRNNPLPRGWYPRTKLFELANETLIYLRALFRDIDHLKANSPFIAPVGVNTGDLVFVGNKVGPHARTTFTGLRYLLRLYANYTRTKFWDPTLNFQSLEARVHYLSASVASQSTPEQREAVQKLGVDVTAEPPYVTPAQARGLESLGILDEVVHALRYVGQNPFYLLDAATSVRSLESPIRLLAATLRQIRMDYSASTVSDTVFEVITPKVDSCIQLLEPLRMRLTKTNIEEEVERIRQLGRRGLSQVVGSVEDTTSQLEKMVRRSIV
jgi:hypothetical protein